MGSSAGFKSFVFFFLVAAKRKSNNTIHVAVSRRVQGAGKGGLFLGQLDQVIGNAESTHVNRPKGKAPLVPNVRS